MGWLFGHYDRKSLVRQLTEGNGVKTLKRCFVGNNMWAVQEYQREGMSHPIRFICLYMMQGNPRVTNDPCNWGYKDLSEDMGPYQVSCPISYIELVEAHEKEHGYEPTSHAPEWRKSVREAHARKHRKLVEGSIISLYGREYKVGGMAGNRRIIWSQEDNRMYGLKRSQMKDVEVLA